MSLTPIYKCIIQPSESFGFQKRCYDLIDFMPKRCVKLVQVNDILANIKFKICFKHNLLV